LSAVESFFEEILPKEEIHDKKKFDIADDQGCFVFYSEHKSLLQELCSKNVDVSKIIRILVDNGSDVNFLNEQGGTMIHQISHRSRNENSIQILFNDGVDINAKDNSGGTSLHYAASNERVELLNSIVLTNAVDFLVEDNYGRTAMDLLQNPENGNFLITSFNDWKKNIKLISNRLFSGDHIVEGQPNTIISVPEASNKIKGFLLGNRL
jgi:ankyrin repeat protein